MSWMSRKHLRTLISHQERLLNIVEAQHEKLNSLAGRFEHHANRLHEHIEDVKRQLAGQKELRGPKKAKRKRP